MNADIAETDGIRISIHEFRDGSLVLSCGEDGMDSDLIFASGAMRGDTMLEKQRRILEWIVSRLTPNAELTERRAVEKDCAKRLRRVDRMIEEESSNVKFRPPSPLLAKVAPATPGYACDYKGERK